MSDLSPDEARRLLALFPLDKAGKVKGTAATLLPAIKDFLRTKAKDKNLGITEDRFGNFVWAANPSTGEVPYRYHFTTQRVQTQKKFAGEWTPQDSHPYKDFAQKLVDILSRATGDAAVIAKSKAGTAAAKQAKKDVRLKAAAKKEAYTEQGLQALAAELQNPELMREFVLHQSLEARDALVPILRKLQPLPSGDIGEHNAFLLSPFGLPFEKAVEMRFEAQTPVGPVSVVQVPLRPQQHIVDCCDLHIGDSKTSFRVSPRKHSVSYGMSSAFTSEGPGYLSATWDYMGYSAGDADSVLRSELFFVMAHEPHKGVGQALVQLWLDCALNAVGGDAKQLELYIKSITPQALPFWQKMVERGVFDVVGGTGGDWRIMPPGQSKTRKNPAPAADAPRPTLAAVANIAKRLGITSSTANAFRRGFQVEWDEHGGGVPLVTIGQLVADHLAEDPRYYNRLRKH